MRAVSLFSGVGGFELGLQRAGIETVLQAEQDRLCLGVLERHWPDVKRVQDVRDVQKKTIKGRPDLIYGGFPCQDLSVAGKRAGLGGERSNLWFEFQRVLFELRPRWALIENVPGLLSNNRGRDFGTILSSLDELGFAVGWTILDAQHFGVPQRRRRVYIVGGPDRHAIEQILAICESCGRYPSAGQAKKQKVASTLRGRSHGPRSNALGRGGEEAIGDNLVVSHSVQTRPHRGADHETLVMPTLDLSLAERRWLNAQSIGKFEAMRASGAGVRRLTPLECERLMGWPDNHTRYTVDGIEIADSNRYRMCGNGVVSTVAEWIGRRLVKVVETE